MKRHRILHHEDGVTLIELLAVITMLAIITTIVYSVGFQGLKSEKTASSTMLLNQNANIFINDLRTQYYKGEKELCSEPNTTLIIKEMKINNEYLDLVNNCIVLSKEQTESEVNAPLAIQITFINEEEKELTLETVWYNVSPENITLYIDSDNEIPPIEDGWIEMDKLPCLNNNNFNDKNIIWKGEGYEKGCTEHGTYGNLIITGKAELENKNNIHVGGDLTANKKLELQGKSSINVEGKLTAKNKIELEDNSNLTVIGNLEAKKKVDLEDQAKLTVTGSMSVGDKLEMQNSSSITINENLTVNKKVELENSATLIIGGNFTVKDDVEMQNSSFINVDGDLTINKKLDIQDKASIEHKGNRNINQISSGICFQEKDSITIIERCK